MALSLGSRAYFKCPGGREEDTDDFGRAVGSPVAWTHSRLAFILEWNRAFLGWWGDQGLRSAQREQLLACGQPPRWSSLRETLISPAPCVFAPTDSRDSFQPLELAVSKDGGDKPEETERG